VIHEKDFYYSIDGFTPGKSYKIHVVAYPKHHICGEPIQSNTEVRTTEHKATFLVCHFFSPVHRLFDAEFHEDSFFNKNEAVFENRFILLPNESMFFVYSKSEDTIESVSVSGRPFTR
jgi:hypothetical protein